MSLYKEMVAAGIPCHNHQSDLYVPVNPKTREILSRYPVEKRCTTTFHNQVEGGMWFDISFAYEPYWEKRAAERALAHNSVQ